MNINFPKSLEEFKFHLKDPLYKNSLYILLTLIINAFFGFIFWIIAAKLYSQENVGINTALLSAMNLIAVLSFLGLDQSIIRFFPKGNKLNIMVTSSIIITIATIIFGLIFVIGINIWSPQLEIVKNNLVLFFVFLIAFSLTLPLSQAFIALRKSKYYLYQTMMMGTRILIIFLPILGELGIFLSFGFSSITAVLCSFYFLYKLKNKKFNVKKHLKIDKDFLRKSFHFSAVNYILGILLTVPGFLLPIIVLTVLGSEQAANYYISYSVAYLLFMIPSAFGISLFVEGSYGKSLLNTTIKSSAAIFGILIPAAIFLYLFGVNILLIFGESYTNGFEFLRCLIISSFFVSISYTYFSVQKIQNNIKELLVINIIIFSLLIGLSYPLMIKFGLLGVGYAWIISYFSCTLLASFKSINYIFKNYT